MYLDTKMEQHSGNQAICGARNACAALMVPPMYMRRAGALFLSLISPAACAGVFDVFRLEDGHTNWQYVANTSGTVLIAALSYTLVRLFLINRAARRYNDELEAIRSELEARVRERTATLD